MPSRKETRNPFLNALLALSYVVFRHPVRPVTGRPRDVFVAVILLFGLHLAINRSYFDVAVSFSLYGFQQWLGMMALWYLTMAVVAVLVRQETRLGVISVVGTMAATVGYFLAYGWYAAVDGLPLNPYVTYWASVALGVVPMAIALSVLTARPLRRNALWGLLIAIAVGVQSAILPFYFVQPYLFQPSESGAEASASQNWTYPDPEIVYPMQPQLMARQIDALADQVPGQVDLFALLGAGYPSQMIFQREVAAMGRVLEDRFDAEGRIIRLGASFEAHTDWPLLNQTNFREGLMALSERMDTDEDIALVFLTSHGSTDQISTSFSGLSFRDLSASDVAAAFEASDIRNAVIIISACYSGSFIDELESERRLVITASAADRNSFGCDDRNEFTDWGTAFFGDALLQTYDFRQAAEIARDLVQISEEERDLTPSLPQTSLGRDIGPALDALNARLAADG